MSFTEVPLLHGFLDTILVSGCLKVAVRPVLSVTGTDLIMGSDP